MLNDFPGTVESSSNLAVVKSKNGTILLQVPARGDAGLLGQLAHGGPGDVLAVEEEAAGEGGLAGVGLEEAVHQEDPQGAVGDGEGDDVDGDGQAGRGGRRRCRGRAGSDVGHDPTLD